MSKKNDVTGAVVGLVALLATVAFLLVGFMTKHWHPTWLIFLAIPVASIITDMVSKKKGVGGMVTGIVSLLATAAFFLMGFYLGLWHPGWIVFFAVPISALIVKLCTAGEKKPDDADAQ